MANPLGAPWRGDHLVGRTVEPDDQDARPAGRRRLAACQNEGCGEQKNGAQREHAGLVARPPPADRRAFPTGHARNPILPLVPPTPR